MSRIGKKPIVVPSGVKVAQQGDSIQVEGPKGKLSALVHPAIKLMVTADRIECKFEGKGDQRNVFGLTRTLVTNMLQGASVGFKKVLEINGVGFRAQVKGQILEMALGFSHPVHYPIPAGITIAVDKQTILTITGADKQLVGQTAAEIRHLRKPEPYKGKGVKYQTEVIKRKAGKSASS